MKAFVATKLDEYTKARSAAGVLESLTIFRRRPSATGRQAAPAPNRALKAALVNHILYHGPLFKRVADWYSRVFNSSRSPPPADTDRHAVGREDRAARVTADDVPVSYIGADAQSCGRRGQSAARAPEPVTSASMSLHGRCLRP